MGHGAIIASTQYAIRTKRNAIDLRIDPTGNKEGVVPIRHILSIGDAI